MQINKKETGSLQLFHYCLLHCQAHGLLQAKCLSLVTLLIICAMGMRELGFFTELISQSFQCLPCLSTCVTRVEVVKYRGKFCSQIMKVSHATLRERAPRNNSGTPAVDRQGEGSGNCKGPGWERVWTRNREQASVAGGNRAGHWSMIGDENKSEGRAPGA